MKRGTNSGGVLSSTKDQGAEVGEEVALGAVRVIKQDTHDDSFLGVAAADKEGERLTDSRKNRGGRGTLSQKEDSLGLIFRPDVGFHETIG